MIPMIGDALPGLRVEAVEADHIRILALILADPNPIHFDLEAVAAAGLGDREVNQGGTTMAWIANMLIAWAGSRSAVRRLDCRLAANVFAGDRVSVGGTVVGVRCGDGEHLVDCDVWAELANGIRPVTGRATVGLPIDGQ
ncbi:MAG: MaoC/PaaZ C-terminal domain-containing protein [Sporichthyaceae bacterium]